VFLAGLSAKPNGPKGKPSHLVHYYTNKNTADYIQALGIQTDSSNQKHQNLTSISLDQKPSENGTYFKKSSRSNIRHHTSKYRPLRFRSIPQIKKKPRNEPASPSTKTHLKMEHISKSLNAPTSDITPANTGP
jgi:hypothetical protein